MRYAISSCGTLEVRGRTTGSVWVLIDFFDQAAGEKKYGDDPRWQEYKR